MRTVEELNEDELNELRNTYFDDFEGLLDYTCAYDVTNKDLFSHYAGIGFVEEDFFCNL